MSPVSVKKTQQQYLSVVQKLEGKLLHLRSRRETMDTRAFVVLDEGGTSVHPTPGLDEQPELYHGEVGSLVSTATDILITALRIKLSYVHDILERLSLLVNENPRQATPTELSFSRYEEWLESNQQLFEFNSQLYELERVKFELKQKHERVKKTLSMQVPEERESEIPTDASQLAYNSISQVQSLLTRFHRQSHSSSTTRVYIHELLNPRGGKITLESMKVQEYITECFQHADADPNEVKGVHSERYQEFMGVLCSFIVEKQREWQREEVSYELVYNAVEHCIMPHLKTLVLSRVAQPDRDDIIKEKCHAFSGVTLDQLRVRPELQSDEPVPFIDSITQLRASYFSSTPTDKMYSVVSAVKALYDQLESLEETSIDGDAFLDLWIYVIIKANVKDLVTNLRFMIEYGNPQLANGEAGYYLTTLEAAVQFIATLTPQTLQSPSGQMEFVVCERAHFISLCSQAGSGMELVAGEVEMQGYRVAVLQHWALNRARLFRSALVPTANYSDTVKVAVIRVNQENTSPAVVQYLLKQLSAEGLHEEGLFAKSIPLGTGVFVNMSSIDRRNVILLPTGDYDQHSSSITHILHLQRLGSLSTEHGKEDSYSIPSSTLHSRTFDIPVSPPYSSTTRGTTQLGKSSESRFPTQSAFDIERKQVSTPLWSPYVLSQNFSPEQRERFHEALFTHPVAGSSLKSEHRVLQQVRSTPDSVDTQQSGNSRVELSHSVPALSDISSESNSANQGESSVRQPTTVIVEVEVHEENVLLTSRPVLQHQQARGRDLDTCLDADHGLDSEEDKVESTLNLIMASSKTKRRQAEPVASGVVDIESCDIGGEREEERTRAEGQKGESEEICSKVGRNSEAGEESEVCADPVPRQNILSPEYREELEKAFVTNHLYGNWPQSIVEAAQSIIMQAQMYLQRLNYLSVSYKITGEYDDITLQAIKTFQSAHNHHEAKYSVSLPDNGHLTPPTYQFLRQAFLTIYASMLRLGLDKHLGETFDPMSTLPRDMAMFRECVTDLQREHGLKECQTGAMCANTIEKVKQLLRSQKRQPIS